MAPPIKVSVRVKYDNILAMARELSRRSPLPYKRIVLMETASIVKIAALRAKIASAAQIQRDATERISHQFTSPDGTLVTVNKHRNVGRTWIAPQDRRDNPALGYRKGQGGAARSVWLMVFAAGPARGWHLPDDVWMAYLVAVDDRAGALKVLVASLLRRRGLMRFSWIQIGDHLGVQLSSVSPQGNLQERIARSARGPRGRTYANGAAQVTMTSRNLIIRLRNESPLAIKNRGQAELDRAMAQRFKGFEIALRKGVLDDLQAASRRWKGIIVRAA